MKPDVVEIAPPSCSRTLTPTKAETPEVIDAKLYDTLSGGVLNGSNVDPKNKGKAIEEFDSLSYDDQDDDYVAGSPGDAYGYPGSSPVSNSLLDPDSLIYDDDYDYADQSTYEMEETDNYSMYQDLFDAKDVPTGVEVSMDWFPNSADKESAKSSKSSHDKNGNVSDVTASSSKKATTGGGIHSQSSFSAMVTHVAQPWNALPHNSKGVIPNSAYALPQNSKGFQYPAPPFTLGSASATSKTYFSSPFQPQTPDLVTGEAPAPGPASSGLLLPVPPSTSGLKGYGARQRLGEVVAPPDPSRVKRKMEDYLSTYVFFKRFDIVEDYSDHHYASKGSTSKQYTKEWAKRIQEEWKILENDLPDLIFVRAYESRMDLLRAVIIGAQGTPYHDGLFFFDIFFPDTYPSVPPIVHYHSGGLRINPNLYNCGKVCLSLLGTWAGNQREEKWIPNKSTMLQVLVSIQGLILNQKPYFNEPGYERSAGSVMGEKNSKDYSENTLILSLKTMVYTMRRPPKYFEDFAYGHFYSCAHDVLKACNAYRNGAPPGTLVKGAQDVEESSQSSSEKFRTDVATFVETVLLKEFILLGVLGLEEEGEENGTETKNVAESSNSTRSSSKRDRVSSS
ncbi:hypothetical protein CARUB_v10013237mg [Capsella rubella]|uniref:E2 ubiquitin-conjugating enzyme n=1 Tax=Capsella rubella TaxID=81985 RepID=R0G443_9BRAS|nr:probable ubiquitin-conjugating enzyme E2 25 [Capsella rubella]EOA30131.1 hypothetical protein CARUB_v10013237mg [Capsella rubella]